MKKDIIRGLHEIQTDEKFIRTGLKGYINSGQKIITTEYKDWNSFRHRVSFNLKV